MISRYKFWANQTEEIVIKRWPTEGSKLNQMINLEEYLKGDIYVIRGFHNWNNTSATRIWTPILTLKVKIVLFVVKKLVTNVWEITQLRQLQPQNRQLSDANWWSKIYCSVPLIICIVPKIVQGTEGRILRHKTRRDWEGFINFMNRLNLKHDKTAKSM